MGDPALDRGHRLTSGPCVRAGQPLSQARGQGGLLGTCSSGHLPGGASGLSSGVWLGWRCTRAWEYGGSDVLERQGPGSPTPAWGTCTLLGLLGCGVLGQETCLPWISG